VSASIEVVVVVEAEVRKVLGVAEVIWVRWRRSAPATDKVTAGSSSVDVGVGVAFASAFATVVATEEVVSAAATPEEEEPASSVVLLEDDAREDVAFALRWMVTVLVRVMRSVVVVSCVEEADINVDDEESDSVPWTNSVVVSVEVMSSVVVEVVADSLKPRLWNL